MRFVTRIIALSRTLRLARELREIEQLIGSLSRANVRNLALLTLREATRAGQCEFPHLYGTPPELRYALWGTGTQTGMVRARSDNTQVRLRGIALWLAVTYYETRDSGLAQAEEIHRQVLTNLRKLREQVPDELANAARKHAAEAAA